MSNTGNGLIGRFVDDRSLMTKITGAVLVALVAGTTAAVASLSAMGTIRTQATRAADRDAAALTALGNFRQSAALVAADSVAVRIPADAAAAVTDMRTNLAGASTAIAALSTSLAGTSAAGAAGQAATAWGQLRSFLTSPVPEDTPAEVAAASATYQGRTAALDAADSKAETALAGLVSASDRGARNRESSARWTIVAVLGIATACSLLLCAGIVRRTNRSLGTLRAVVGALAAGDLTRRSGLEQSDEIGQMARALDGACAVLQTGFSSVADSARALATSSDRLRRIADEAAGSAERASGAQVIAETSSEKVSADVTTISTASEEMAVSIQEIGASAAQASQVAADAVAVVAATNAAVEGLRTASAEISGVVTVITGIAEQTNLLALNATIEAARAGQAGKGFAVVAGEVKELAQGTRKATDDITARVQSIQTESAAAVAAIDTIQGIIEEISNNQGTIAAAVEEQAATASSINTTLASAADGSSQIARHIGDMAAATHQTVSVITETSSAATTMAGLSTDLQALVDRFTYRVA